MLPAFLCSFTPVQQTTSGIGHRVEVVLSRIGDQYAECENQQNNNPPLYGRIRSHSRSRSHPCNRPRPRSCSRPHPASASLWTPFPLRRGSTIGEDGDPTISSPRRSPKQPLPGMRLHDPLHGRQACPKFIAFDEGVGQICPR